MATKAPAKSPRKAASPRKANPRKAARPRAADATRGDAAPVNGAVVASAPDASTPANGEVRESALPQDNSGMIKSPYPVGVPTYTFFPVLVDNDGKPLDGVPPIIIPKYATLNPTRRWLWDIYDKGPLIQAFEWMMLAKVPRDIQERVVELPDEEYERFWDGWFGEARTTQGE